MPELKPCPFCGGKAKMKINPTTLNCNVTCDRCGVIMKQNFKGNKRIDALLGELMTDAWNRRGNDA